MENRTRPRAFRNAEEQPEWPAGEKKHADVYVKEELMRWKVSKKIRRSKGEGFKRYIKGR